MQWDILKLAKNIKAIYPEYSLEIMINKLEALEKSLPEPPSLELYEGKKLVDFLQRSFGFFDSNFPEFRQIGIDRGCLLDILEQLNHKLAKYGIELIVYVYGGCALLLLECGNRRSLDFDFVFVSKDIGTVSKILREIEEEFQLPPSAFDKTMGPLIATHFKKNETTLFSKMSNLTIQLCTARQMLAMKVFSARLDDKYADLEDAINLCNHLGISFFA